MTAARAPAGTLVLLHGANGCSEEMRPWRDALTGLFGVHLLDLQGHGGREIPPELTAEGMTEDVLRQLDLRGLGRVALMGYSFGGVVAAKLAARQPERFTGLVTVATKWVYSAEAVCHVTHLLEIPRLTGLAHRREHLSRVHQPNDWRLLARRLQAMFAGLEAAPPLTADELARITCPALVLSGSSDPLVSTDETVALHRAVAGSEIALYRGPAHPADRIPVQGLRRAMERWAQRRLMAPPPAEA